MSENTLKPCPFCGTQPRLIGFQSCACDNNECQNYGHPFLLEHWNTRPTPSSALTKALKVLQARRKANVAPWRIDEALKQLGLDAADWLEALRASPGGEGITHHENCGCSDAVIERAEIRGAEWALIDGLSSAKPICPHGNFQERAAAIVASHHDSQENDTAEMMREFNDKGIDVLRSPAPEKEGRHE